MATEATPSAQNQVMSAPEILAGEKESKSVSSHLDWASTLPPDVGSHPTVIGFPGDRPSKTDGRVETRQVTKLFEEAGICCCVVSDVALQHYNVASSRNSVSTLSSTSSLHALRAPDSPLFSSDPFISVQFYLYMRGLLSLALPFRSLKTLASSAGCQADYLLGYHHLRSGGHAAARPGRA